MLKKANTPRSTLKRVKFDASSIRSEGRALHKYANLKRKEHNEGRWLQKLDQMFVVTPTAEGDENQDTSNVAQREENCGSNTPDFNKGRYATGRAEVNVNDFLK